MTNGLAERLSLSLILADALFCHDFASWGVGEDLRSVGALAMVPYLSAYAADSSVFLRRTLGDVSAPLVAHKEFIAKSRLRAKLFDDTERAFSAVMAQGALVAALNSQWFFRSRFGPIEAAKKLLVPDLGVCLFGGEFICTTHVGFLNLGMDESRAVNWNPKRLSREVSAMAEAIGRYTATTLDLLGQPVGGGNEHASQTAGSVKWKDMRSARLYGQLELVDGSRRDAVAIVLTSLLAAANTARLLVPLVSPGNVTSEVKWQFVTLFHLTLCIRNLLNLASRESVLRPVLRERLSELVEELPSPTKKRKDLRNVFMHYGIAGEMASRLVPDGPLCGLVEAHLGEFSYEEFEVEVRNGLEQAARVLGSLMPSNVVGNRAKPRHV